MSEEKFRQIQPHLILAGMYPETDIFYLVEKNPVLLCHGRVIDDGILKKLHEITETGVRLYVQEDTYEHLIEQYDFISRTNQKNAAEYRLATEQCRDFLKYVKETNSIEKESVVRLVAVAKNTLAEMDPSFILQWTKYTGEMDEPLQTHSIDVALLNGMIGKWLELKEADIRKLLVIGLLHDLGKLRMPDGILNKPGKFTQEEFAVIKLHPVFSYEMMFSSGITDKDLLMGVRSHHERCTGSGYPDGLKIEDINLFARITAVSDVYDAMISKRVYKNSNTPFEVLDTFFKNQFSDLDIRIVEVFLEKMVAQLQGKHVILSNGRTGEISYIDKEHVLFPMVKTKDEVFQTDRTCHVVSVCGDLI